MSADLAVIRRVVPRSRRRRCLRSLRPALRNRSPRAALGRSAHRDRSHRDGARLLGDARSRRCATVRAAAVAMVVMYTALYPAAFLVEEVSFRGAIDPHLPVSHPLPLPLQMIELVVVHVLLGVPLSFAWRRTGPERPPEDHRWSWKNPPLPGWKPMTVSDHRLCSATERRPTPRARQTRGARRCLHGPRPR